MITMKMPTEKFSYLQANSWRSPNIDLILLHRLRRWPNIKPALGQRLVFAWR